MKQCILLVEDNKNIIKINKRTLEMEGYQVRVAKTLEQAKGILCEEMIDLIVLDIMLPDGSGVDFCRELRSESLLPILFLTALGGKDNIIEGVKSGGDDYLSKPYDLDILLLRIEALLRRVSLDRKNDRITYGPLMIDGSAHRVFLEGQDVNLTIKEYSVLIYLLNHSDTPCLPKDIYQVVWGLPANDNPTVVRMHISALRKKLHMEDRIDLEIENVFREGYRIWIRG